MFSDSDDGRDATLDKRYGFDYGDGNDDKSPVGASNIKPDSKFDRSFSFSDGDNDSYVDTDQVPPRLQISEGATPVATEKKSVKASKPNPINSLNSVPFPQTNAYDNDDDFGDDTGIESSELASLFSLISNFQPEPVDITVHWKPFIPDLVPAIGAIDAFIKVPRPDHEEEVLGLTILDEPSISQSNPQVQKMELREQYGLTSPGNETDGYIGFIENPSQNRKALDSWLESIEEIHRNRPPPVLIYTAQMPEMEELMQPWDDRFEETLKSCPLPTAELDISLEEYARIICSILGIPVRGNIIESLHHLFSLYSEFEANHYFQSQEQT